ncbi:peptidoglycan recognition protein 1 [Pteronotus mesoamericanus]|uniref:peptidoglycan recognition protein 1 n=1 Tax=Pteronotus mesoamericanus TaxID=1884717 RepID=UPI0023EC178A|nr:peptidoglycan recognition protein 1 [Pteronotus parnellii mesoamericanus]
MTRRGAPVAWALLALLALPGLGAEEDDETCCGPIVPRREWNALASDCTEELKLPVRYVVVSHTAGSHCDTAASCRQQVQNVQYYHKQKLDYCDVAYNFLIGEDGLVYEGRGWNYTGAHTSRWNPYTIGISFMGNYMERAPPPRAIRAAKSLIGCGVARGALLPKYKVKGHRDLQRTLSPGDQLYEIIQKWPHYKS